MSRFSQEAFDKFFGVDAKIVKTIILLAGRLPTFEEGVFKQGFETAIEEIGARGDLFAGDSGTQLQDIANLVMLMVNGDAITIEGVPSEIKAKFDAYDDHVATIAKLTEALEPFAGIADDEESVGRDDPDDDRVWISQAFGCQLAEVSTEDFRRVREALSLAKSEDG